MPEYGFSINVTGKSIQQMKQIENELTRLGVQAKSVGKDAESAFDPFSSKLTEITRKIGEVFAVREVYEFGKRILETTAEFEGFENRIKFASLSAYDAAQNMSFLRSEVEKLHIPIRQAYEGFSEMEAGLVGTGIEGDKLRQLFNGLETAAATLHISQFNQARMLLDFKEIGEIGLNRRIYRSLSPALPGLNKIIKEAFNGKSWDDLEHEGLGGAEFLAKIGPALAKHFQGGLENFSNSLQAKMTDVSNHWTETILKMGNKLEPFFKEILGSLTSIMESGPFQLVIRNIDTVATGLVRLGAIWLTYKGIMLGIVGVEKLYTLTTTIMTVANYTAAFGVQGLKYALGELGISLTAVMTSIGVFSLAIIIEQFSELNHKILENIENITHFKQMTGQFQNVNSGTADALTAYKLAKTKEDQSAALGGAIQQLANVGDALKKANIHLDESQVYRRDLRTGKAKGSGYSLDDKTLAENIKGYQDEIKSLNDQMAKLNSVITTLQKLGIKPPVTNIPLANNDSNNLHGSHLAGAEGGLNQARIVNLHIDQVMHVETHDNRNLKDHAERAAGYVIRALNNISESKSGTQ